MHGESVISSQPSLGISETTFHLSFFSSIPFFPIPISETSPFTSHHPFSLFLYELSHRDPIPAMDSDQALELSLGVGKRCGGYIPPSITNFLNHLSMIKDISERLAELNEYVSKLEQEMRKLDALKRNPQHCMLLLKDGKMYR